MWAERRAGVVNGKDFRTTVEGEWNAKSRRYSLDSEFTPAAGWTMDNRLPIGHQFSESRRFEPRTFLSRTLSCRWPGQGDVQSREPSNGGEILRRNMLR
jgi:hypothetical protein